MTWSHIMLRWRDFNDKEHTEYLPLPPGNTSVDGERVINNWFLKNGAKVKAVPLTMAVNKEAD